MSTSSGYGRTTQTTIYRGGASGTRPAVPTRPKDLEAAAHRMTSREAWAYVAGERGVGEALRNIIAESCLALGHSGRTSVAELTRDALEHV